MTRGAALQLFYSLSSIGGIMLLLALLGIGFSVAVYVVTRAPDRSVHEVIHDLEQPRRG